MRPRRKPDEPPPFEVAYAETKAPTPGELPELIRIGAKELEEEVIFLAKETEPLAARAAEDEPRARAELRAALQRNEEELRAVVARAREAVEAVMASGTTEAATAAVELAALDPDRALERIGGQPPDVQLDMLWKMSEHGPDAALAALTFVPVPAEAKLDLAVVALTHAPDAANRLDLIPLTPGEKLAIALRVARRDTKAFITLLEHTEIVFDDEERIAVAEDFITRKPDLFPRAAEALHLSPEEISEIVAGTPPDLKKRMLLALEVPGFIGAKPVTPPEVTAMGRRESPTPEGVRDREDIEGFVATLKAASRELLLAVEAARPDRTERERERARLEAELHGELETYGELGMGEAATNKPLYVTYKDRSLPAIYKPKKREATVLDEMRFGGNASREWLAFQIDRALGLDLVPVTVLRDGPEGLGSVQDWRVAKGAYTFENWHTKANFDDTAKLAFFDAATRNLDRHNGNFLISADGHIQAVDNGVMLTGNRTFPLRSRPLKTVENLPLLPVVKDVIVAYRRAPDVQQALRRAFDVALGPDAADRWNEFNGQISLMEKNGKFPAEEYQAQEEALKRKEQLKQGAKIRDQADNPHAP